MGLMIQAKLQACNLMLLFADMLFAACDMRPGDTGDKAISKSYKYIDLSPVDGSSVYFFSSEL